jgi:iron complex outermembrane receptor protein
LVLQAQIPVKNIIKKVIIKSSKLKVSHTQSIDSNSIEAFKQSTLTNLLSQQTAIAIKNYGPSSFSTLSIRGSSAAQTTVNWHGLNIANAQHGLVDANTLHTLFFDKIDIQYGGSIQANAVGGSILLGNNFSKENKLDILVAGNTMNAFQIGAKHEYDSNKLHISTSLFLNKAKNNFKYKNTLTNKIEESTHSNLQDFSGTNTIRYVISPKIIVSNYSWFIFQRRQIPKTFFESESTKKDTINTLRNNMGIKYSSNKTTVQFNLGTFLENMKYNDSNTSTRFYSSIMSLPYTFTTTYNFNKNYNFSFHSDGLYAFNTFNKNENLQRISFAFINNFSFLKNKLQLQAILKNEFTSLQKIPPIYSFTASYQAKNYSIFATTNKSYRLPTLNELYFSPSSNKNLKPEIATNYETGCTLNKTIKNLHIKHSAAFYHRVVQDWILWSGASILYPRNISEVISKGFEQETNITFKSRKNNYHASVLYAYTLSTTSKTLYANDNSIGKQLPYIPRYLIRTNTCFSTNHFYLNYNLVYNSYRFVTNDESQFLTPYILHNVDIKYKTASKQNPISLIFTINNISNKSYESIVARPMPLRNYSLMMLINLYSKAN